MGRTGIVGIMEEEIALLKEKMDIEVVVKKASMEFYQGRMNEREVVLVCSGIGKVNASLCTQILVDVFHVSRLINTGVAVSLKEEIQIGDIVISVDAIQHDMDVRAFGYERGEIPRMGMLAFPADEELVAMAQAASEEEWPECGVFVGRIASGDQYIAEQAVKNEIASWTEAACVEIEGAAIAQAATLNRVPFVIVRAILDKADGTADMDSLAVEQQVVLNNVKLVENFVSRIPLDAF